MEIQKITIFLIYKYFVLIVIVKPITTVLKTEKILKKNHIVSNVVKNYMKELLLVYVEIVEIKHKLTNQSVLLKKNC